MDSRRALPTPASLGLGAVKPAGLLGLQGPRALPGGCGALPDVRSGEFTDHAVTREAGGGAAQGHRRQTGSEGPVACPTSPSWCGPQLQPPTPQNFRFRLTRREGGRGGKETGVQGALGRQEQPPVLALVRHQGKLLGESNRQWGLLPDALQSPPPPKLCWAPLPVSVTPSATPGYPLVTHGDNQVGKDTGGGQAGRPPVWGWVTSSFQCGASPPHPSLAPDALPRGATPRQPALRLGLYWRVNINKNKRELERRGNWRAIYKCTPWTWAAAAHQPEQGSEQGEQGCEDQDGLGGRVACGVPTRGLPGPGVPLLGTAWPCPLELQLWDDPVDPVVVGGEPDVDTWAVPPGAALAPADDPCLQPHLAHEAHQGAPGISLRPKQRYLCQRTWAGEPGSAAARLSARACLPSLVSAQDTPAPAALPFQPGVPISLSIATLPTLNHLREVS